MSVLEASVYFAFSGMCGYCSRFEKFALGEVVMELHAPGHFRTRVCCCSFLNGLIVSKCRSLSQRGRAAITERLAAAG